MFKALADPTRRRIVRMLNGHELSAGEIARQFDISAPSISHHLAILREASLVTARREGQQIFYSLDTTVVQDFLATVMDLFALDTLEPRELKSEA